MMLKCKLFSVALVSALWLSTAPVKAADDIVLSAEVKARVMALEPLRGNGVNGTAFDGRPVLVTFFASW